MIRPARLVKHLILGAGPTGLGAAWRLKELGEENFLIAEAADRVGGLAKSYRDEAGFVWDLGVHVQYSHYRYFDDLMEKLLAPHEWLHLGRDSSVWIRDRFVPYPLQSHVRYLPRKDQWKVVGSLLANRIRAEVAPHNFREWADHIFGRGMAEIFLWPYNAKVWACPPEEMGFGWIKERVPEISLRRVLENIVLGKDPAAWGPNRTFRFPRQGGTGAIWERLADRIGREKILLRTGVEKIDPAAKVALLADGSSVKYEECLSTIPLPNLVSRSENPAPAMIEAAGSLRHSSVSVVGLGLEGRIPDRLRGKNWIYFPDEDLPFYRVTIFSGLSRENVPYPERQWSLLAEVSHLPGQGLPPQELTQSVILGARRAGLLEEGAKIVSTWCTRLSHGYPVPCLERDRALATLEKGLSPLGLRSRGRFGGWKYEVGNQDHSMMQGVEWADCVTENKPEITYFHPEKVNVYPVK